MVSFGLVRFGTRYHAVQAGLKLNYVAKDGQQIEITGQVPLHQASFIIIITIE